MNVYDFNRYVRPIAHLVLLLVGLLVLMMVVRMVEDTDYDDDTVTIIYSCKGVMKNVDKFPVQVVEECIALRGKNG